MDKINFNDRYGLTEAVLERRKTMTRRDPVFKDLVSPNTCWLTEGADSGKLALCDSNLIVAKSRYKRGQILAVAQPYKDVIHHADFETLDAAVMAESPGWNNKLFVRADLMPHQIQITNIAIERLQDISDEDCIREGVEYALAAIAYHGAERYERKADNAYWIAGGDGDDYYDQGLSYCYDCAVKVAAAENKAKGGAIYRVEGGSLQEEESFSSCEECGRPLLFGYLDFYFYQDIGEWQIDDDSDLYIIDQLMYTERKDEVVRHFARQTFAALIDKVSGKGTWQKNPYIFAYTFELIK